MEQFDNFEKSLINKGKDLSETLATKGWKETVEPLLDQMIADVLGAKRNGRWSSGLFSDKTMTDMTAQNLAWYRQALIDFHCHIYQCIDEMNMAIERSRNKENDKEMLVRPFEDSDYNNISNDFYNKKKEGYES